MRAGGLPGAYGRLAGRGLVLAVVAAVVAAVVGVPAGMASASVVAHRAVRPGPPAAGGSGLSLEQAPAGLRAAVRRTLGGGAAGPGSAFEQAKLTAAGGAAGDHLGLSVAIAGSTAVVGADAANSSAGAAYVFTRSGTTWSQQAELTAAGGAAGDDFGASVAIAGSTAVVGAPGRSSDTGAAYVFTRSGTTWSQQAELTDPGAAAGDYFGGSVAISGSTVVVGADESGNGGNGAAYVFTGSGGTWSEQARLTASDGASGFLFGGSVAISASTVVVGAYGNNSKTGAAYLFTGSGASWSQQAELTASDGVPGNLFGGSVAIAGSKVVVGAYGHDSDTGAAYVFTGSGGTWSQQAELTAAGGVAGDDFGASVAIAGSTAVVGAPDFTASGAGAAYTFTRAGTAWSQQAELADPGGVAGDDFGRSVAIAGSTAVVGADGTSSATGAAYVFVLPSQQAELPGDAIADNFGYSVAIAGSTAVVGAYATNSNTGAAYVFTGSGGTWSQQAELTASDGAVGDEFGLSVAISGSTVVVGAFLKNSEAGAVYLFKGSGGTWSQQAELTASDAAAYDFFGYSVAISGSTVLVGAYGNNGAAYVFKGSGGTWSQQAELTAPAGAAGEGFGTSVAIAKSTAVVSAPGANSGAGAAYVFTGSGGTWSQQAELTASDAADGDDFGESVAITGSTAVVGAPEADNSGTGAAYVFARSRGTWSQQAELTASDGADGDYFGGSVAISGSTVVVGASLKDSARGAAYVFAGSGGTWPQQAELTSSGGAFGDSVAIAGSTAVVGAFNTKEARGAAYVFVNV